MVLAKPSSKAKTLRLQNLKKTNSRELDMRIMSETINDY